MTDLSSEEMADLIMDRLPSHQRNAVLAAMYQGEDTDISPQGVPRKRHNPLRTLTCIGILIPMVFLWSLPLMVIGFMLTFTVVLAPIGLFLMASGSMPINYVIGRLGKLDSGPKEKRF